MEEDKIILNNPKFNIDIDGKEVANNFIKAMVKSMKDADKKHKETIILLKQIRDNLK